MDELALFAGAGGGLLATHHFLGWRTVAAVELELYRQDVLGARQRDGFLGSCPFPIFSDIRDFDGAIWRGRVDVVTAGFPCQPFSGAGKRLGPDDPRNMWPDTARVIREVRPRYVLLENSPKLAAYPPRLAVVVALLDLLGGKKRRRLERLFNPGGYLGTVLGDLAACGFNAEWDCFPASSIGAPHRRDRLWILAYSNADGRGRSSPESGKQGRPESGQPHARCEYAGDFPNTDGIDVDDAGRGASALQRKRWEEARLRGGLPDADLERLRDVPGWRIGPRWRGQTEPPNDGAAGHVADAAEAGRDFERSAGEALPRSEKELRPAGRPRREWIGWPPEPRLGRIAPHGMADRLDRVEAIGDGQVPGVAALAWASLARRAGILSPTA